MRPVGEDVVAQRADHPYRDVVERFRVGAMKRRTAPWALLTLDVAEFLPVPQDGRSLARRGLIGKFRRVIFHMREILCCGGYRG
jgi:hypothetical protein